MRMTSAALEGAAAFARLLRSPRASRRARSRSAGVCVSHGASVGVGRPEVSAFTHGVRVIRVLLHGIAVATPCWRGVRLRVSGETTAFGSGVVSSTRTRAALRSA